MKTVLVGSFRLTHPTRYPLQYFIWRTCDCLVCRKGVEGCFALSYPFSSRERESLGSTGIGQGIGIPHAKSQNVKTLVAAFGLSQKGVNFDSLDGEPVYIFFLLIAPEESAGPHLKALARISRMLKDKYFRELLKKSKDEKEVLRIIQEEDSKKY